MNAFSIDLSDASFVTLLVGIGLLWVSRWVDRKVGQAGGDGAVVLGIASEILAAWLGFNGSAGTHVWGILATGHLAWIVVGYIWFRILISRKRSVEFPPWIHHCKPKLFISDSRPPYETTKKSSWRSFLNVKYDVKATDSRIDMKAHAYGAYLWSGFWPVDGETDVHLWAIIDCVERKGKCRPVYHPGGDGKGASGPTQVHIFPDWYDHGDEVGCYPYMIAGLDGAAASISPPLPGGGWATGDIPGAKEVADQNMGHFEWICPAEAEKFEGSHKGLDEWVPAKKAGN